MAKNLDQTGVILVNGSWATSVKYASAAVGAEANNVELRFMQGRSEVAKVTLSREQVLNVLGEQNAQAIERHIANDADKYLAIVKGELRGQRLQYREVTVQADQAATQENTIAPTPVREPSQGREADSNKTAADQSSPSSDAKGPPSDNAAPEAQNQEEESRPTNEQTAKKPVDPRVPAAIAARYLVKGKTYHFDDETVAFVDQGSHLTARTHNKAIIEDLIAIAKAREWQAITVSGTKDFRREAWKEATAQGLDVTGYNPTKLEQAAAERHRKPSEGPPAADPVPDRPTQPKAGPASHSAPVERKEGAAAGEVTYGQLISHGQAPYPNEQYQSMSYFVTIKEASGRDRTFWGVGLKQALRDAETHPAMNSQVGIRRVGATPVTVVQRTADENGEMIAQSIPAKRQQWQIETAEYFTRQGRGEGARGASEDKSSTGLTKDQEVAAAIRSAATTREELQLNYPQLNKAVFQYMDAHERFAEAYIKVGLIREADRAQVIGQMRERLAGRIERSDYPEPTAKEVDSLIIKTVHRAAEDIGRTPVKIKSKTPGMPPPVPSPPVREDVQVRT